MTSLDREPAWTRNGRANEFDEVFDGRSRNTFVQNAGDFFVNRSATLRNDADGGFDRVDFVLRVSGALHTDRVRCAHNGVFSLSDRKWKNVFIYRRIARDKRVLSDPHELVESAHSADLDVVFKYHVARELRRICDHAVITDLAIVRDVGVRHN